MKDRFVHTEETTLHYTIVGNGPKTLLLFHGFGQDNHVFLPLAEALASTYTVYIFDLYFHGKSHWSREEDPLEKKEWKKVMHAFIAQHKVHQFSVGGFSLGGKFALATTEAFPEKIDALFLIAPDGIKTSFWYSLATFPFLFRRFFKSMILKPGRFSAIANAMQSLGLVDKGLIRFAEYQMNTQEKRNRVYYSWVVFRKLKFNLNSLARLINHHHIVVTMITGKYDKVIQTKNMNRLLKKLNHPHVEVLDVGHNGLVGSDTLVKIINGSQGSVANTTTSLHH